MLKPFPLRIVLGLMFGSGIGISILAASFVERWETSNRQLRFQRQIENLGTTLQRSLNRYTDVLASLNDFYSVHSISIDRQQFAQFVARSLQTYSGIQALEWAPVIQASERPSFEQNVQTDFPNFQITELDRDGRLIRAGERPYHVPVTYVEPLSGNETALGFDLNSNVTRAKAIAQSRDTGQITATGRVRLVQETRNQFGFLVFSPLYQKPSANSVAQTSQIPQTIALRRQQFQGVLLGVFRVSDVIEEGLQNLPSDINFKIYDLDAEPAEQFLGRYDAVLGQVVTQENPPPDGPLSSHDQSLCSGVERCTQVLRVGQRQWLIKFSPADNYPSENHYEAIVTLLSGLLLTSLLVVFLHSLNRTFQEQAFRDSLTGLYNRRYFVETLNQEIARATRGNYPIAVLLMDLDYFKSINDTYGHRVGDQVLQAFGKVLQEQVRAGDIICRYGGEEFAAALPGMMVQIAYDRAEHIRDHCQSIRLYVEGQPVTVTVSIGVALFPEHGSNQDDLLHAADQALYAAKANGRNCIKLIQ